MAIREIAATVPATISLRARSKTPLELAIALEGDLAPVLRTISLCADWIEHRQIAVTASYEIIDETAIFADATAGAIAVTLPASDETTINRDLHIKKTDSSANAVTITRRGTDTIDGLTSIAITTEGQSFHLLADGLGKWRVLSTVSASSSGGVVAPATAAPIIVNLTAAAVGTSVKYAREDHRHLFDVTIDPTGANAWTGTHAWSPDSDVVPVTINAASLVTGNMQTWNPTDNEDTVVTVAGDVGIGDPAPAANLSIQARGVDYQAEILALNPYAWWDASDIDADGTNNSGYADGASISALADKSQSGTHDLAAALDSILRKSGGPNNQPYIDMLTPVFDGAWNAWPGTAWGNPASWLVYIVYNAAADLDTAGCHFLLGGAGQDRTLKLGDPTITGIPCRYFNNDTNPHKAVAYKHEISGVDPTPWSTSWYAFSWQWNGSSSGLHQGYIQGAALDADPANDEGGAASPANSTWTRLLAQTGGSHRPVNFAEILMFDTDISAANRAMIDAYLASKYSSTATIGIAQPLTQWKDASGTVDSIVDEALNFGIGTDSPAAKLHIVDATEQLRIAYDTNSYTALTATAASGALSYTLPTASAVGVLHNSAGSVWSWSLISLTADVSGTLPIANGGTGQTTALAAFNALSPLTTRGDLLTRDATNNIRLAIGASATILRSDGTDAAWASLSTAGIQPLDTDLTEIAAVANVRGDLLLTNSGPTWVRLPIGTNTYVLTSDGTDASWQAPTGGGVATDTIWDAKGDLAVGTAPNTAVRLAVGTDGYVLTASSGATEGVVWAAASGGVGEILISDTPSTPLIFDDLLQNEDEDDLVYADV